MSECMNAENNQRDYQKDPLGILVPTKGRNHYSKYCSPWAFLTVSPFYTQTPSHAPTRPFN